MKTDVELLDLLAQAYSCGNIDIVKNLLAGDIIYLRQGDEQTIIGIENVCAQIERSFAYYELFKVTAIRRGEEEWSMDHVSFED